MFDELIERLEEKISLVYPEGTDPRILKASARIAEEGRIKPILLGDEEKIRALAQKEGLDISSVEIINHMTADISEMKSRFLELRKGKNTEEEADSLLRLAPYFGTMLVKMGKAQGMVAGAVESSASILKPGFQIVKTKPGNSRVSGAMVMLGPNGEKYIFSDIAINIRHTADQLAELASQSAETARLFGLDPKIAFLSFSTMGSAVSEETDLVRQAVKIAKEKYPDLCLDGELQFDAALVPSVGKKKAPESEIAGKANVFIFPDLNSGNIGYKIAQRLGGYEALGPLLQGIGAPISDLSRGCSEEDVYKVSIITALQAQMDMREVK